MELKSVFWSVSIGHSYKRYANESLLCYFDERYNVLQPNCFMLFVLFCFYDLYVVLVRYRRQAFLTMRKLAEVIHYQNDISQWIIPDSAINRWNDISLKRYIVMMFCTLYDISFERYIAGRMYRWNDLSSERDIAGELRYLVDLGVKEMNDISVIYRKNKAR